MVWTAPADAPIEGLAAAGAECSSSIFEAPAVVSCFEDVAVVRQAVEQRSCHLGITKHIRPFAEAEVGGDNDAGLLIELAEQVEQQCPAGGTEW